MALFQKQPITNSSAPPYTSSANRTYLIVGLGNPGKKYIGTRHNIGFDIVDEFGRASNFPGWVAKKDLKVELNITNLVDNHVILAKPQTFMNLSGEAISAIQHFYKIPNSQTLVAYDELAIPFGQLRTRVGGSDAGHNGVKSLIAHLDASFGRLRIGVGPTPARIDPADFVLSKFSKAQQASLSLILREASSMISEYIFSGQLPHDTRSVI